MVGKNLLNVTIASLRKQRKMFEQKVNFQVKLATFQILT